MAGRSTQPLGGTIPLQRDIRPAALADAEALVRIHFRSVHGIPCGFYSADLLASWSPTPDERRFEWMRDAIRADERKVLVAEESGTLCGFSIVTPVSGFIHALYVDPLHSRQGIGQALLDATEQAVRRVGIAEAEVFSSHNAQGFYSAAGYSFIALANQPLADGSHLECVHMRKRLAGAA